MKKKLLAEFMNNRLLSELNELQNFFKDAFLRPRNFMNFFKFKFFLYSAGVYNTFQSLLPKVGIKSFF